MATAKQLPSGAWRVQASVTVNGEKLRRSFTDTTAKGAERQAEEWQEYCRMIGSDSSQLTVKEAIKWYVETEDKQLSPSTKKEYLRIAEKGMQDIINKPLYSLTCPIIKNSMRKALETLDPKTVKNRYALLKRMLTVYHPSFVWAIDFPKQKKKQKRMFSDKYISNILQAIKGNSFELEIYLGILSMRASEIAGAKWCDVDFKNKTLHVCRTKLLNSDNVYEIVEGTKTEGSDRLIYLPDYVLSLLQERKRQSNSDFITEVLPRAYWDRLNYILEKHKLEPLPFHGLRHIYSSLSSSLGIDAQIRMANGGWSSEKVMDGNYRHSMLEQQVSANEKMNNYINKAANIHTKVHTKSRKRLKLVRFGT